MPGAHSVTSSGRPHLLRFCLSLDVFIGLCGNSTFLWSLLEIWILTPLHHHTVILQSIIKQLLGLLKGQFSGLFSLQKNIQARVLPLQRLSTQQMIELGRETASAQRRHF